MGEYFGKYGIEQQAGLVNTILLPTASNPMTLSNLGYITSMTNSQQRIFLCEHVRQTLVGDFQF